MNTIKMKTYWYPVCRSREVRRRPIPKTLLGIGLVLVRYDNTLVCFENRCPHRGVPLSGGKVHECRLRCNYHGWSFDSEGELVSLPGVPDPQESARLNKKTCRESNGIVWVRLEGDRKFEDPFGVPERGFGEKGMFKYMRSDYIHSIENFLDPTHTPFIHEGLVRSSGRQMMRVWQSSSERGFETHYHLEDRQNGLVNTLFDSGIDTNIATFRMPGFAKLEYLKREKLQLRVSIFFVPIEIGTVGMLVRVYVPKRGFPTAMIFLILRPFLEIAFFQDRKILETHWKFRQRYGDLNKIMEADLVIDHLLHLIAEKENGKNKEMTMIL